MHCAESGQVPQPKRCSWCMWL